MRTMLILLLVGLAERTGGARDSVTLLPLGDSITEGVPTSDGYRGFLRQSLEKEGISVRFVGSRRSPAGAHEGWSGFTTDELLERLGAGLWAKTPPDFVLLHIGTNDIGLGRGHERAATGTIHLLERLFVLVPKSDVLLAQLIPMVRAGPRLENEVQKLNSDLAAIAAGRRQAGQRVHLVDMHKALDPLHDLEDELHPNENGYRKIGRAWAGAIRSVLRQKSVHGTRK